MGCLYLFTGGLLGIGWLIDICLIPGLVNDKMLRTYGNPNGTPNPPQVIIYQQAPAPGGKPVGVPVGSVVHPSVAGYPPAQQPPMQQQQAYNPSAPAF